MVETHSSIVHIVHLIYLVPLVKRRVATDGLIFSKGVNPCLSSSSKPCPNYVRINPCLSSSFYFFGCDAMLCQIIPFAILWWIWNKRNGMIFRGELTSIKVLLSRVSLRMAKWAYTRGEFKCMRLDNIMHYWEASLSCGPSKERMRMS